MAALPVRWPASLSEAPPAVEAAPAEAHGPSLGIAAGGCPVQEAPAQAKRARGVFPLPYLQRERSEAAGSLRAGARRKPDRGGTHHRRFQFPTSGPHILDGRVHFDGSLILITDRKFDFLYQK